MRRTARRMLGAIARDRSRVPDAGGLGHPAPLARRPVTVEATLTGRRPEPPLAARPLPLRRRPT